MCDDDFPTDIQLRIAFTLIQTQSSCHTTSQPARVAADGSLTKTQSSAFSFSPVSSKLQTPCVGLCETNGHTVRRKASPTIVHIVMYQTQWYNNAMPLPQHQERRSARCWAGKTPVSLLIRDYFQAVFVWPNPLSLLDRIQRCYRGTTEVGWWKRPFTRQLTIVNSVQSTAVYDSTKWQSIGTLDEIMEDDVKVVFHVTQLHTNSNPVRARTFPTNSGVMLERSKAPINPRTRAFSVSALCMHRIPWWAP
jgi:hypothetical protein